MTGTGRWRCPTGPASTPNCPCPGYDTPEKIGTATRRTAEQVAGSLAVYRLGAAAWRAADADQLTLEDALELDELRTADPETAQTVLDKADSGVNLRFAITDAQRKRRDAEVLAAARADLEAAGVTVLDLRPPRR